MHTAYCATTGANGTLITTGWDYNDNGIPYLTLTVRDSSADGHHVRVRLVTSHVDGKTYFPWHANYDGAGSAKTFESYVSGYGTISGAAIQVARFEGDTLLNYCTEWASD
ncbi:hypothetical protein SAMN06272735_4231 [Streptomyces sp. TLI_55]|nr:hypothetical protein SAMN06272735_4231 [Streptomyces sp. TLI_55]